MPKYYQASFVDGKDRTYQICDTSQTTIEKKATVWVEAVEIPPLSLKSFVNTLNLTQKPLSREVVAVFAPRQTGKGHLVAKRLKLGKMKKQTKNISFHPNIDYLSEIA